MKFLNYHLLLLLLAYAAAAVNGQFSKIPFAERAEQFSKRLRESALQTLEEPQQLLQNSSAKLLELELLEPFVDYGAVNASAVVEQLTSELSRFFQVRVDALMASVREAEAIVQNHTTVTKIENVDTYFSLEIKEQNWKVPTNMTYMREFRGEVFEPASTAYVTRDVYYRAPHVVNGLAWTTRLDKIWKENRQLRNVTGWQYFGSRSGFVRVYPGYKWTHSEGEDNNNYNPAYDLRRYPWYGQGVTSPKDILILIDTSGSVYGQPLQYMKIAAFNFIETLSENDYVNIMTFNQQAQLITPQINTFVPANERNKKMLKRYLDSVLPLNQAMYAGAFESAFQLFDSENFTNATEFLNSGFGANCNPLIVLLSDGGTEFPEEVFKEMNWNKRAPKAPEEDLRWMNVSTDKNAQAELGYARSLRRIFAYALGQQQNPTTALKKTACTNRGYFKHILDIGAIKTVIERYNEVLQRPMIEKMETPVTFSNRYFEQDGMNYVVSVLAPVYNRTDEKDEFGYSSASVLGLMANDISLSQIMNDTIGPISRQLGSTGYIFIINQNGFALVHPRLQPMDDLLVLSNGNIKDKQVNDGVDILDLEFEDDARNEIRRRMIDGESGSVTLDEVLMRCTHNDTALYHATVTYTFAPIRGTPFSACVVVPLRGTIRRVVSFMSNAEEKEPGDDSPRLQEADEQRQMAVSRLLRAAFEALQLPTETRTYTNSTNRTTPASMHYHSMTLPTQIEFCNSLPTAPWSTKMGDSSGDSSKTDAESGNSEMSSTAPNPTDTVDSSESNESEQSGFPAPSDSEQPTDSASTKTQSSDGSNGNAPSGTEESDVAGGDPAVQTRDEEAATFLRFVYAHLDAFTGKLRRFNDSGNVTEYVSDCGTPETYQVLVDTVIIQPIMNVWMDAVASDSPLFNSSHGILSKLIISGHSLVAGYPKFRFDEYLAKNWFSPLARYNTLYESASLSLPASTASAIHDFMYHIHFEVIRVTGELPRLFAITPLRMPVSKLTRLGFPSYVLGVAAVEVNSSYFDWLLEDSVPECDGEALCYLIDEFSYVVAASTLATQVAMQGENTAGNNGSSSGSPFIGAPLLDVNAPLFLALLHDGVFLRTGFYFTQEKCESPSQLAGASSGNSPFSFAFWSRLFSFVSMHVSQLLSTSFWADSYASLFSSSPHSLFVDFADAASPAKGGRKGGRKSKKRGAATQQQAEEEDERRCIINITRFVLNNSAFERESMRLSGSFRCDGNCEKGYAIMAVPGTSLYLVMTATNFTCSLVRHSHAGSGTTHSQITALGEAASTSVTVNFTVTSFDANCALVNGVLNSSMLQLEPDYPSSLDGGVRLESEVRVGDGEYAARMRKRYRRRPETCYDFWVDENPNCGTWSLFSAPFGALAICNCVLLTLRRFAY